MKLGTGAVDSKAPAWADPGERGSFGEHADDGRALRAILGAGGTQEASLRCLCLLWQDQPLYNVVSRDLSSVPFIALFFIFLGFTFLPNKLLTVIW